MTSTLASARTPRLPAISTIALGALLLSACAGSPPESQGVESTETPAALTLTNCGVDVVFDDAPDRVITVKSTSTELMLSLGLGDRIVGTAFQDGPIPAALEPMDPLPAISDGVPNQEAALEYSPDLIVSGWESTFSADGVGDRAELAALGVASYVSPPACQSTGTLPKLTFDSLFADMVEFGSIFGADGAEAAEDLVTAQAARVAALGPTTAGDPVTALWYSSGEETPFVGAGLGAPQLVMETAGLTNIAGDLESTWSPLGWEAIIAADPDVIILVDAAWNTAQSKIDKLESDPATAQLAAVTNGRYIVVPFAASEAGVRTVEAAELVDSAVEELGLR